MKHDISFGIDTYSWQKLITLYENGWKSAIISILVNYHIFVTHEVKKEFLHRFAKFEFLLDYVTHLPKLGINFQLYKISGFDTADASLIEYSKQENRIIITEDHPMLSLVNNENSVFIQLIDFFLIINQTGGITNNQFYRLVQFFRKIKNITKRKENLLRRIIRS